MEYHTEIYLIYLELQRLTLPLPQKDWGDRPSYGDLCFIPTMSLFSTPDFDSDPDTSGNRTLPECYHSSSLLLDTATQELLNCLGSFADAHFEGQLMNLRQEKIVSIAALLIQQWTRQLDGRQITGILLAIREGTTLQS